MYDPLTTPVDYITLAGKVSPGLATVNGAGSPREWEERRGPGWIGSALVYRGKKLARFEVEIRLYTSKDWADWAAWKKVLALPKQPPRSNKEVAALALAISHPWLSQHDIKSAVVEDVQGPAEIDNGGFVFTIKFIEWRAFTTQPPLKPVGNQQNADYNDPSAALIAQLADQFQELAK